MFDPHSVFFSNPLNPVPLDSYFIQFETIQKNLKIPLGPVAAPCSIKG